MACVYKVNGEANAVNTEVLQYMEDNLGTNTSQQIQDISNILARLNVIESTEEGDRILDKEAIQHLNQGMNKFFNVPNFITINEKGKDSFALYNESNLSAAVQLSEEEYTNKSKNYVKAEEVEDETEEETDTAEPIEDLSQDETDEIEELKVPGQDLINEVFNRKNNKDELTQRIVTNLELQIERLERLQQTEPVKKRLNEIKVLQKKLERVEKDSETLTDYYDFIHYTINLAERGQSFLDKIEVEYAYNYKTLPKEKREEMLKDISDLKETLDAFYNKVSSRSISTLLLQKLDELEDQGGAKDELIIKLADSIAEMAKIDQRYLDIGIPIQVDYLMSWAPIEANEQLQARIDQIRKTGQLSGLSMRDPKYAGILKRTLLNPAERRKALLELNIEQLENKKIGRQSLIDELRATHKDASKLSALADPLIYSSEPAIQMFALAVKEKMVEASQATIETKYRLVEAFREFKAARGVGEDNPAKLYEGMYETITEYIYDKKNNTYIPREALSFVQEVNITKYNNALRKAFDKFRKDFNFPEHPSEYDDYFKSDQGKKYLAATVQWFQENTDAIEGWEEIENEMSKGLDYYKAEIAKAYKNEEITKAMGLQNELNGLEYEYKKMFRNGKPIGRMTKPKMSLYSNPKFTAMDAATRKYYNLLLEIYKEDQKKLGKNGTRKNSWDDFSYILPTIRKSTYDKGVEEGWINLGWLGDAIGEGATLQETDTEFGELVKANGEEIKYIPKYYTNYVVPNLVSKDLTNSIVKFNDMSNRYKAKGQIIGVVNIMQSAVAERRTYKLSPTGETLYIKAAQKFGYEIASPGEGKDTETYKQLTAFIDMFYYGKKYTNQKFNAFGKEISMNKLTSAMSTGVALSTLSLNFLQAFNQVVIDTAMGSQESMAGQFYSYQDHLWARAKLHYSGGEFQSIRAAYESINEKFTKQNKITKMLEMFDAFQEMGNAFGDNTGSAFKKKLTPGTLFLAQKAAETSVTATKMLAMSRAYKGKLRDASGKVLLNEAGEEADLWDMLIEDKRGKLIVDPRVANFNIAEFTAKLNGLVRRTNQLKGEFDRTNLERYWYGAAVTLFRKYLMPGYRKRFGHSQGGAHVDVEMGQVTEGYYGAVLDSLLDAVHLVRTKNYGEALKVMFGKNADAQKKYALRRFAYEVSFIALMKAVSAMVMAMMDDDDDDNWLLSMLAYQALRAKTEMFAYVNPFEFIRIIENPTATTNFLKNGIQLAIAVNDLAGYSIGVVDESEVKYQKRSGMYEKGDYKWVKKFTDLVPGVAGIFKTLDPDEALSYYKLKSEE